MIRRKPASTHAAAPSHTDASGSRPQNGDKKVGLRALSTLLMERWRFAQNGALGMTFGGRRDVYTTLGYNPQRLTIRDFRARYERGGIAERIVEAYPNATWAGGARIVEDHDPTVETEFEKAVRILFDKRDVWSRLNRADILASLGRFSVLLLGARGALNSPLPDKIDDLLYITPLAEDRIRIKTWEDDPTDPRFGRPKTYGLTISSSFGDDGTPTAGTEQEVHWTRVIHVAEGLLENEIYGKPRLRSIWNYLDDLDKLVGGGAEAAWKRMDPGMQVDVDPDIEMDEDEEQLLDDEIEEYQHDVRRVMRTRGTKINLLSSQVQGFGPNTDTVLQLIAATTGIPHRILTGSERGELASSQDRFNWADRINERRRGFATPLVRQLIGRLVERGVLPSPSGTSSSDAENAAVGTETEQIPGGYDIIWPEVGDINNESKAVVVSKLASANQQMYTAGLAPIMTGDEIRNTILGLGPLDLKEKDKIPPQDKTVDPNAAPNPGGKSDVPPPNGQGSGPDPSTGKNPSNDMPPDTTPSSKGRP